MEQITSDFFAFIKGEQETPKRSVQTKLFMLIKLLLGFLLITFLIYTFFLVINGGAPNSGSNNLYSTSIRYTTVVLVILIIGSTIEEVAFRLLLGSFHLKNFCLSLGFIAGYVLLNIANFNGSLPTNLIEIIGYSQIMLSGFLIYLVITILVKKQASNLSNWWNRNTVQFSIYSSLVFALFHYKSILSQAFPFSLQNLISLILLGVMLSFIRIKLGFIYAVLFHILINTPTAILQIVFLAKD